MRARNQVRGGPGTLLRSGEGRVRLRQTLTGHPLAGCCREPCGFPTEPLATQRFSKKQIPAGILGFPRATTWPPIT